MYKRWIMLFLTGASLVSCGPVASEKPTLEYFPNMVDSPAVKAQEKTMRSPVPGTVPVGFEAYPYKVDEGDKAGVALKNPLSVNKENLENGKNLYNTYCIVCHGPTGKGNGTIVPKFPMPPTLHSEKVTTWSDGRIFHVITMGQNLMPSYKTQIKPEERWAIILYVRALQRAVAPTKEDVEQYKKTLE